MTVRHNPYTSKAQHRLFRTPYYEGLPEQRGRFAGFGKTQPAASTQEDVAGGPQQPPGAAPAGSTWWQQHSSEIIVGTITAVTGALAVYFAMRWVGKKQ